MAAGSRLGAVVELDNGASRIGVVPAMGAGLAYLDVLGPSGQWQPVLRPWSGQPADGPFALASNLLLPWSGRISNGGFHWRGRFHDLAPNLEGERFPIHGNGFQLPWQIAEQRSDAIVLAVVSDGPGPFAYDATIEYRLADHTLRQTLTITSRSAISLPYGIGFHPWFVRTAATTLDAPAATVWLEDAAHLPAGHTPVSDRPDWDFSRARRLPDTWINNLFTGWSRQAVLRWPDRDMKATIAASEGLSALLVYSPSGDADFVCCEPVSHLIDAHNQTAESTHDLGDRGGLVTLSEGQSLSGFMTIGADFGL